MRQQTGTGTDGVPGILNSRNHLQAKFIFLLRKSVPVPLFLDLHAPLRRAASVLLRPVSSILADRISSTKSAFKT